MNNEEEKTANYSQLKSFLIKTNSIMDNINGDEAVSTNILIWS